MSLNGDGRVQTQWFLRSGRKTEPPKYLDAADRRQYRAGRDAFLRAANKLSVRLGPQAARSWRALRRLAPLLLVAAGAAVILSGYAIQRAAVERADQMSFGGGSR
jgi:hypothetical protein